MATCSDCPTCHPTAMLRKYYFKAKDRTRHADVHPAHGAAGDPHAQAEIARCRGRTACAATATSFPEPDHPSPAPRGSPARPFHKDDGRLCWECHRETPHGRVHGARPRPTSLPALLLLSLAGWLGCRNSRNVLEDELGLARCRRRPPSSPRSAGRPPHRAHPEDAEGEGLRAARTLSRQLETVRTAAHAHRGLRARRPPCCSTPGPLPIGAQLHPSWCATASSCTACFRVESARTPGALRGHRRTAVQDRLRAAARRRRGGRRRGRRGQRRVLPGPLKLLFRAYAGLLAITLLVLALAAVFTGRALARPIENLVAERAAHRRRRSVDEGHRRSRRARSVFCRASSRRCARASGEIRSSAEDDAGRHRARGERPARRHRAVRPGSSPKT